MCESILLPSDLICEADKKWQGLDLSAAGKYERVEAGGVAMD